MTLPQGGPMDPVTRRAEEEKRVEAQKKEAAADNKHLEAMAAFLGAANSDAAKKLMDIVEAVLLERIIGFLNESAECRILLDVLERFNDQRNIARRAVDRLMKQAGGK